MKDENIKKNAEDEANVTIRMKEMDKQNEELRQRLKAIDEMKNETKNEDNPKADDGGIDAILKSREVLEKQLAEMVVKGESNPPVVDKLVKIYANMVKEGDFVMDETGALKVGNDCFLKHLDQDNLNHEKELVGKQIIQAISDKFTGTVMKRARRLSISLKRKSDSELHEKETPVNRHRKKGKNSPTHKK